jgi:hypothetical protein
MLQRPGRCKLLSPLYHANGPIKKSFVKGDIIIKVFGGWNIATDEMVLERKVHTYLLKRHLDRKADPQEVLQ